MILDKQERQKEFLDSIPKKKASDPMKQFVYTKVEECGGDLIKIYDLGIRFKKGSVKDYPHSQESDHAVRASFLCFQYVHILGMKTPELYHNLAMSFLHFKDDNAAEGFFLMASNLGLEASKRNLEKLQTRKRKEKQKVDDEIKKSMVPLNQMINTLSFFSPEKISTVSKNIAEGISRSMGVTLDPSVVDDMTSKIREKTEPTYRELQETATKISEAFSSRKKSDHEKAYRLIPKKLTPENVNEALFKESQLVELMRIATFIYDHTKENDVVLMLGRSPLWISEMFKCLEFKREILEIPFSGGSDLLSTASLDIPEEAFIAYKDFLGFKGLNQDFFSKQPGRKLVLVDRVEKGYSIISFSNILKEISPSFNNHTVDIIGFGDQTSINIGGNFQFIVMEHETLAETRKKHGDNYIYSLGVDFFADEWINWRNKDFNPKLSEIVIARQEQIKSWCADNKPEPSCQY